MKKITIILLFLATSYSYAQVPLADELVDIHSATTIEMNAIVNPDEGSMIYNTTEKCIYQRTDTAWVKIGESISVFTGTFIISAEGVTTVTGIPFEPSQVTFVANANVESLNIDSDNGTGDNDRGIDNSFGTMNGFARNINGTLTQQAIFIGGSGNSINDISRYASSSNCIGVRYGDQNGSSLGKIEGAFSGITSDGFNITVNYTDGVVNVNNGNPLVDVKPTDVNNESLLVIFTAYK
ncbi:MAG: hypothetical protein WBF67_10660 [Olleya sp.]